MSKKENALEMMFESRRTEHYEVKKLRDGGYVKKYYEIVRDENGKPRKVYTDFAERMTLLEKFKHDHPQFFKSKGICKKGKKNGCLKIALVSTLAVAITVGGIALAFAAGNSKKDVEIRHENAYAQKADETKTEEKVLQKPTPVTYEQNGQTFISLDSSIEISKYNYQNLKKELAAYNKTASGSKKYNFNPTMFDYATFVGLQIKESSLKLNDPNDTACKGGFKLGSAAIKEANEVSLNLTGEKIIETEADLNDPIKSSKACMYVFVKNYEYLHDEIENNALSAKVSTQMVVDEYLFGCGNLFKELNGDGYTQKTYSKIISDYAQIVRPFADFLETENLTKEQKDKERRATFNKLYQVPEKYSSLEK